MQSVDPEVERHLDATKDLRLDAVERDLQSGDVRREGADVWPSWRGGQHRAHPARAAKPRILASRAAIAASRSRRRRARSTTGTSIILPSTVTAPTPSASALS